LVVKYVDGDRSWQSIVLKKMKKQVRFDLFR
jgi:hypothetical protein